MSGPLGSSRCPATPVGLGRGRRAELCAEAAAEGGEPAVPMVVVRMSVDALRSVQERFLFSGNATRLCVCACVSVCAHVENVQKGKNL